MVEEYTKRPGNAYMFLSFRTAGIFGPDFFLHTHEKIFVAIGAEHIQFHNLWHTFVTTALEYGMDVKTLSAVVGHRSSSTTLNVYTHVTKAMERQAAAKIDQGIGKQEVPTEEAQETKHPTMTTFRADPGKRRKTGTGCVHQIGEHLWEGRYSPRGPDGKQRSQNVYGHTPEECEEKLKVLIETMKAEIQAERKQLREEGNRP